MLLSTRNALRLLLFFWQNRVLTLIEHILIDHNACKTVNFTSSCDVVVTLFTSSFFTFHLERNSTSCCVFKPSLIQKHCGVLNSPMKMKMEAMSPRSVGSPHSMKMEDAPTPPPVPNNLKRPLPPPPQMPLPPPPSVDSGIANPELQSFSSAVSQSLHLQNIDYKMNWHWSQVRLIKFLIF